MNNTQVIEDLKTLKEYFIEQAGNYPACLDYAIKAVEQPKCINQRECTWKKEGQIIC